MLDSAIAASKKAISIDPNLVEAYRALGLAYAKKGLKAEAYEAYHRAIELDPKINADSVLPYNCMNDYSNLLTDFEEGILNDKLKQFQKETSIVITVLLIATIKPYFDDHKTFATVTFNRWGIGEIQKDNGIFFTNATKDREVRITVGFGMENVFTNEICGKILDENVFPNLKKGNYYEAISECIDQIIAISRNNLSKLKEQWDFRIKTHQK